MRSLAVVVAVLGSVVFGALAAGAGQGPTGPLTPADHACDLLSNAEIVAAFVGAPLDPGPKKVKLPGRARKNFSQCKWDDGKTRGTVPQLIARTYLARGIKPDLAERLTTAQPDAYGRALTSEELVGIGSKGVIERQPDGAYASVGALKGKDHFIVSIRYVGAPPPTPIVDAAILGLARTAANRV